MHSKMTLKLINDSSDTTTTVTARIKGQLAIYVHWKMAMKPTCVLCVVCVCVCAGRASDL